jgi:hypothetical protein
LIPSNNAILCDYSQAINLADFIFDDLPVLGPEEHPPPPNPN